MLRYVVPIYVYVLIIEQYAATVRVLDVYALIVEQYVGALDVAVQEVALVTVVESVEQLLHERRDAGIVEVNQARLEQTHQVVVHVLEHQVEGTCA